MLQILYSCSVNSWEASCGIDSHRELCIRNTTTKSSGIKKFHLSDISCLLPVFMLTSMTEEGVVREV